MCFFKDFVCIHKYVCIAKGQERHPAASSFLNFIYNVGAVRGLLISSAFAARKMSSGFCIFYFFSHSTIPPLSSHKKKKKSMIHLSITGIPNNFFLHECI